MIPQYKPNVSLITAKIGKIVNNLYWLISNSGSSIQYPKIELGKDRVVVNRHLINLLTVNEKDYITYLAFMYRLNEEENVVVHFKVDMEKFEVTDFPVVLNTLVKSILNTSSLVHEYGVVLNRDNFIKYVGLVGYVDQYEIESIETSLFKMMISDEDIPPSTYENIRLLELNDFIGDFLQMCKRV
ncbi:hypothetical protein [Shewanella phage FishSpeaker]|nr:hypothetical protein [Shewanella phage FishSpeaker]